jgi:hypothetical protein
MFSRMAAKREASPAGERPAKRQALAEIDGNAGSGKRSSVEGRLTMWPWMRGGS